MQRVQLNVRVDPRLRDAVDFACVQRGISQSAFMCAAIIRELGPDYKNVMKEYTPVEYEKELRRITKDFAATGDTQQLSSDMGALSANLRRKSP